MTVPVDPRHPFPVAKIVPARPPPAEQSSRHSRPLAVPRTGGRYHLPRRRLSPSLAALPPLSRLCPSRFRPLARQWPLSRQWRPLDAPKPQRTRRPGHAGKPQACRWLCGRGGCRSTRFRSSSELTQDPSILSPLAAGLGPPSGPLSPLVLLLSTGPLLRRNGGNR